MKKEKTYAILCYIASICLYLAGAINLLGESSSSMRITWFCLGSAMLCFGGVFLNKANRKDDDR